MKSRREDRRAPRVAAPRRRKYVVAHRAAALERRVGPVLPPDQRHTQLSHDDVRALCRLRHDRIVRETRLRLPVGLRRPEPRLPSARPARNLTRGAGHPLHFGRGARGAAVAHLCVAVLLPRAAAQASRPPDRAERLHCHGLAGALPPRSSPARPVSSHPLPQQVLTKNAFGLPEEQPTSVLGIPEYIEAQGWKAPTQHLATELGIISVTIGSYLAMKPAIKAKKA